MQQLFHLPGVKIIFCHVRMIALSGVFQQLGFLFIFFFFWGGGSFFCFVCVFGFFNALLKLQDIIKDLYVANVSFFAECFLLETFTVLISTRFSSSVLKRFLCLWIFSITHWSCCAVHPPDYTIKPESLTAALQGPLLKLERPFICCVHSVLSNYPALHLYYSRICIVI